MTILIVSIFILIILAIGFIQVFKGVGRISQNHIFAFDYREKFIKFANKYFENYNPSNGNRKLDGELYIWLTKNVNKIQKAVGQFGIMDYIAPFQTYKASNYQIIINAIPKFRDGQVKDFDVNSVDDCLLRYIGYLEEQLKQKKRSLKNPFIWFQIGFQKIIIIPLLILNGFGIFSKRTVNNIAESASFKVFSGLIALTTLISGIVTIIQGKEKTMQFIMDILEK